jgi:hypothetical protein
MVFIITKSKKGKNPQMQNGQIYYGIFMQGEISQNNENESFLQ